MIKPGQNGFVMIIVIAAMAVIGMAMYLLANDSNIMLFQSNTAYLRAVERNLTASGLAWAKQNIKNQNNEAFDKSIELDVADMNIRESSLTVFIHAPTDKEPEVQINTSCSRSRRILTNNNKYRIAG